MTVQLAHRTIQLKDQHVEAFGEKSLPHAPSVSVFKKISATPQQYLKVDRNFRQLEEIIKRIKAPIGFILFAQSAKSVFYIQVGIIGVENYPNASADKNMDVRYGNDKEKKIVYGRRWLVEPSMPTSEVVQTALLAVQKAREHELREYFKVRFGDGKACATPFNTHLDLPLMVMVMDDMVEVSSRAMKPDALADSIDRISLDRRQFKLHSLVELNDVETLVQLKIESHDKTPFIFEELLERPLNLVWSKHAPQTLYHNLIEILIGESNRYVKERFLFDGMARFSETIDPIRLAQFSYQTRLVHSTRREFEQEFSDMTYEVDSNKAPTLNSGQLGIEQCKQLHEHNVRSGFKPKDYSR